VTARAITACGDQIFFVHLVKNHFAKGKTMKNIAKEISSLERCIAQLQIPDLANLDSKQAQLLAARIMTLSGKLNQLAYQMLFTFDMTFGFKSKNLK
jgi:hypothetical protein